MRTKASFKSHPIHQMLIPFPIAFLVGAFVFDVLGLITENPNFWITGSYLSIGGIIMGFAAAIPGFVDYIYSVPPESSGHKRATKHMIVNLTAVTLFIIALALRAPLEDKPGLITLLIEALGIALLSLGGWMGGTLVIRNFIGPDHRYAKAGKWNDESFSVKVGEPVNAAGTDELKIDQMKLIRVNGKRIVLARSAEGYSAFDDFCTHKGGSLAGGVMICGTVQCLWHGSQFDVKTGEVKSGPAEKPISVFKVEEAGGMVKIYL